MMVSGGETLVEDLGCVTVEEEKASNNKGSRRGSVTKRLSDTPIRTSAFTGCGINAGKPHKLRTLEPP